MGAPKTLPADFQGWDKAPSGPPPTLPANFSQWDEPSPTPKTPDFSSRVHDFLNSDVMNKPITINGETDRALTHSRDMLVGMLKNLYQISAPNIAQQTYRASTGQPNNLKDVARVAVETGVPMMLGDEVPVTPRPQAAAEPLPAAAESSEGALGRLGEVAKRRLQGLIPGYKTVKDLNYILRGNPEAAPPTPTAPTPQVPDWYGKGQYGTPVSQWGRRIGPPTEPASLADLKQNSAMPKPADVQAAANQAVGYEPPKAGVPIGQQGLPPGHTAVESSAVRSYKYDPDTRTLEIHPTTGTTTYRYGDVSPEQAAAFQQGSAGQAWKAVRQSSSPLIAKRINGNWKPVTVAQPAPTTGNLGDLTDLGQKSFNDVIDGKLMATLNKSEPGLTVSLQQLAKDPALARFTPEQLQASALRLRNAGKVWGHTARAAGEAAESIYGIASR